jgi:hypothetical protein
MAVLLVKVVAEFIVADAGWERMDMEALANPLSMIAVVEWFACTTEVGVGTAVALVDGEGDPVISQRVWLSL